MFARPRDNRISPRPPEVEAISRRPIGPLLRVASPHVLLAEDDEANRWLLAQALMQAGFQVASCRDGLELLDKLAKSLGPGGLCLYDLIVSDIRMPKLTGLEALSRLPHNDGFPPMILITAFGDNDTEAQARELGAAALLKKPFELDTLVAATSELVP